MVSLILTSLVNLFYFGECHAHALVINAGNILDYKVHAGERQMDQLALFVIDEDLRTGRFGFDIAYGFAGEYWNWYQETDELELGTMNGFGSMKSLQCFAFALEKHHKLHVYRKKKEMETKEKPTTQRLTGVCHLGEDKFV